MEKAALAELRWTDASLQHLRIPISLLARHRGEVLVEIAADSHSSPIAA